MKKLIIICLTILITGCSVHIDIGRNRDSKRPHHKKWGKHKQLDSKCNDHCYIYKYDWEFNDLIKDYDHPWCICMAECMENQNYCDEKFPDGFKKKDEELKDTN